MAAKIPSRMNSENLMANSYSPPLKNSAPYFQNDEGGGLRRISPSCRSFCANRVRLIAMTIREPSREIRSAWGLVHGIGSARPADSTYGGLALLPCYESAIRCATVPQIIVGAPRVALRPSRFFDADDAGENYQDEQ